jgi:hypothetical protein
LFIKIISHDHRWSVAVRYRLKASLRLVFSLYFIKYNDSEATVQSGAFAHHVDDRGSLAPNSPLEASASRVVEHLFRMAFATTAVCVVSSSGL